MNKSLTSIAGILLSFTLLTGCNEKANTNATTAPVSGGAQSTISSSASPEPSPSSNQTSPNQISSSSSSSPQKKVSYQAANSVSTNGLAKKIMESARKNETLPHLPKDISLGTSIELIREVLGEPSTGGNILVFEGIHTQLQLDEIAKVEKITSNHPNYKKLDINDVKKEIGKPDEVQEIVKDQKDTGYIKYNIQHQYGENYLVFYYNTKTKKITFVQLYFVSQASKIMS